MKDELIYAEKMRNIGFTTVVVLRTVMGEIFRKLC